MAIEGNDWWAVAGAAVGGLAAGLIGSKLTSSTPKSAPYFVNLRRIYVRQGDSQDEPMQAIASIWSDPESLSYTVRMATHSLIDFETGDLETLSDMTDWIGYFDRHYKYPFEKSGFEDPDESMAWADGYLRQYDFVPITEWSGPLGKEIPPSKYKKFLISPGKRLTSEQR